MGDIRDKLEEILTAEDMAAEFPPAKSGLRRSEPVRLPVADAIRRCGPGELIAASERGEAKAVARLHSGAISVIADVCPHDGGLLSDGFVDGERVVCARHGWEFDGHTGQCLGRKGVAIPCRLHKMPHI